MDTGRPGDDVTPAPAPDPDAAPAPAPVDVSAAASPAQDAVPSTVPAAEVVKDATTTAAAGAASGGAENGAGDGASVAAPSEKPIGPHSDADLVRPRLAEKKKVRCCTGSMWLVQCRDNYVCHHEYIPTDI